MEDIQAIMDILQTEIAKKIEKNYGTVAKFSRVVDIPYSTLNTIIKNGVGGSRFSVIQKICRALEIRLQSEKNFNFSPQNLQILSNFTALDERGKRVVTGVLASEYERCVNE